MRTQCPVCLARPPRGTERCAEHGLYCVESTELPHRARAPYLGRTLLDRYLLVGWLGGDVYRCFDANLRRTVALQLLPAERLAAADDRIRFQREAQALAALDHPALPRLLDYGALPDGLLRGHGYLVYERVGGLGLNRRLARGPLSPDDVRALRETLSAVLAAAHAKGIHHGDLRPENLHLTADGPYLVGFEVAGPPADAAADLAALDAMLPAPAVVPARPVPRPHTHGALAYSRAGRRRGRGCGGRGGCGGGGCRSPA